MKKPLILAAFSAFVLVGAAYPDTPKLAYGPVVAGDQAPATRWRPCRSRSDDHCIQLYERGVRAAYAEWLGAHGERDTRLAAATPHRRHARHRVQVAQRCPESPVTTAAEPEGSSVSGM
jgi:hypothetical protein